MRGLPLIFLLALLAAQADDRDAELEAREIGNPGGENYGEFGPPDAYERGSTHPFYGSENEWSRRMFDARSANLYYKRRGQRALLEILDGQPRQALALASESRDAESLFVKTLALAKLGALDEAKRAMRAALEAGLPEGRFLAGPREFTDRLVGRAARPASIVHGPMLGALTDTSARVWIRTSVTSDFTVRVTDGDVERAFVGKTRAEDDYTGIAELHGLSADTAYRYSVELAKGQAPRIQAFRTYRAKGTPGRFRIAFGGCAGFTPWNERMWDTIGAHKADALLLLGDNVYIDLPEHPGAFHDYTYYRRQSRPEFLRLVSETPVYAVWDDHDAAFDDIWMGPYVDRPAWKRPMIEHFQRNWNNPAAGSASHPGVWFQFSLGDVEIFMLDGRSYRENPFLDAPSMLGAEQKAWLLAGLKRSTARVKLIASPVAWADGAKPGSRDTWSGFAHEREEIFAFIEDHAITGVVLLSSDRHRSEAWRIERGDGPPLYELLSGQLTNVHTHAKMPGAIFSYNEKPSFGLVDVDTTGSDANLTYQVISIDNESIDSLAITLP